MIRLVGRGASVAEVVREAQRGGAEVVVVPAGTDKRQSLERFAQTLHLPEWFGRNLDALADCLHDLAESPTPDGATGRHLVWDGTATLHRSDPEAFEGIVLVLGEVTDDHDGFSVTVVDR